MTYIQMLCLVSNALIEIRYQLKNIQFFDSFIMFPHEIKLKACSIIYNLSFWRGDEHERSLFGLISTYIGNKD